MKLLVTYDIAGTVETKPISGPYIRYHHRADGSLIVKVFEARDGPRIRSHSFRLAYEVEKFDNP